MNAARVKFVLDTLADHRALLSTSPTHPLEGLRIADIGCGGGLLSEPLARLGAEVVAVDASERNVAAATAHKEQGLGLEKLEYVAGTADDLDTAGFDVVCSFEVIEHVADVPAFVGSIANLAKEGGTVCMSTINRTPASYLVAVVAAEQVLQWVPAGTHEWEQFIEPEQLCRLYKGANIQPDEPLGLIYNPIKGDWIPSSVTMVNYMMSGRKLPDV
eukprot:TRINITY_DN30296_c0_g1_i1.p1 TRINITY_DN30296_c0_g1~~TRINITY_DN30296_c0_g1_i1.p1  ORF type:complete len:216 (+),score=37.56 TRINITY_DN30296_c0_g1_i1:162-809(+)